MGQPEVLLHIVRAAAEEAPSDPTVTRQALWSARRDERGWLVADSIGDEAYRANTRDDTAELDVLAQTDAEYLARVLNAHAPLVEALAGLIALVAAAFPSTGAAITAEARAALKLARGEGTT